MSEETTGHRQRLREGFLAGWVQALVGLLLGFAILKYDAESPRFD